MTTVEQRFACIDRAVQMVRNSLSEPPKVDEVLEIARKLESYVKRG